MTALDDTVAALRDCVQVALTHTAAGAPARVCAVPGLLAWDDCCGTLAITVDRIYPSRTALQEATGTDLAAVCAPPYEVADLTVTVLRCAPGPDQSGRPPTCDQMDAAALTWFIDLDAIRDALTCCLASLRDNSTIEEWTLRDQTPAGPGGGCVGSNTRLTVAVSACPCPVG